MSTTIIAWIIFEIVWLMFKYVNNIRKYIFSSIRIGLAMTVLIDEPMFSSFVSAICMLAFTVWFLLKTSQFLYSFTNEGRRQKLKLASEAEIKTAPLFKRS